MDGHRNNRKRFAILLIIIEIVVIVMYGVFVRPLVHNQTQSNSHFYAMYQDVNVMMLIGFGCLMAYVKQHSWSALSYTFMINAVIVQLYILMAGFWHRVFKGGWDHKIQIVQTSFTAASYSVAACLISFGAILGRIGPLQFLILGVVQIIGYTLNQAIVYEVIHAFDAGGSTVIHTYGAYFGLTVSLIIGRICKPNNKPEESYISNMFAMIGTLFLWMFWPSFNAGFFPTSPYQKTTIISNTIIALTGSCLSTFAMTALLRHKLDIDDILNATLAGGVIIGAPSGLFTNPAAPLCVGIFGGIVSSFGFRFLQAKLQSSIGLHDSCGVHNLHGMPGMLGGVFSAIAVAAYSSSGLSNSVQESYLPFYSNGTSGLNEFGRTFYQQGGIQIAAIFTSLGIAIGFGIIAGFLIRLVYAFKPEQFFRDDIYFQAVYSIEHKPIIQFGGYRKPGQAGNSQNFYI